MRLFSNNCIRPAFLCLLFSLVATSFAAGPVFELNKMNPPRLAASFRSEPVQTGSELLVQVTVDSGWHINADTTPDEFLVASRVEAIHPDIHFGKAHWPQPQKIYSEALDLETWVLGGSFTITIPVTQIKTGADPSLTKITLHYQACSNSICLAPAQVSVDLKKKSGETLSVKKADSIPPLNPSRDRPRDLSNNLLLLLFFAFLGGLTLNLMPCVLPVLSIKALSLAKHANESHQKLMVMGLTMSLGILASFWSLAAIIIAIQQAGGSAGWGFQFQNPGFLVAMILLITLLALNMFGVFEIWLPSSTQGTLSHTASRKGVTGAFMSGVLMTLLSTPCSAPFLGSAMGFAFTQPPAILILFFTACGIGLAFPYLMLSLFPQTLRWIPRPGNWMVRFKQFLGFLMLVTAVWLLWVLGRSAGTETMGIVLLLMITIGFGAWVLGLLATPGNAFWKVVLGWILIAAIGFAGWVWYVSPQLDLPQTKKPEACNDNILQKDAQGWMAWSPQVIAELQRQGRTIFVDFTADWCITCKANETAVLASQEVEARFVQMNVARVKADFTRPNAAISEALQLFGRTGVPLYVIYPSRDPQHPIALSELLTTDQVLEALERAGM